MRAPAHNKCTSKTYTERRAELARVEVEDKDVFNIFVLLVGTELTSNTDIYLLYCQSSTPTLSTPLRGRTAKPRWRRGSSKPCSIMCFSEFPFSAVATDVYIHLRA